MGQEVRQDLAVSIEVMLAFQIEMERDWQEEKTIEKRIQLAMIGAYALIAFGGSFRGHEVFLVDTFGLVKYASQRLSEKGMEFVMIPLLGRYKTENAERYHLTPLALRSKSGLEFGRWVSRLADAKMQVYEEFGISRSFRRGATTEARNQQVPESDINLMNRWRNFEKAGGKRPRMRMQDHYSDISLMIPSLLRFSKAL